MRPGEVVVARLKGGARVVRLLDDGPSEVRLALGRNREARVPKDRIILATGVAAAGEDDVGRIRDLSEELASTIDLSEVWDLAAGEGSSMSLDDLAELLWGPPVDPAHRVGLLLHLERTPLYFVEAGGRYVPQSRDAVSKSLARRASEADRAEQTDALIEMLYRGRLSDRLEPFQVGLVGDLRSYAIFGEDHPRSRTAELFASELVRGSGDLQRVSFDILVGAGVLSPDEPLELHRAGIEPEFPQDAIDEADSVDLSAVLDIPGRLDLTELTAITVDDEGTEDRDDALSVEVVDPDAGGSDRTYTVGIHIADAGALVPAGGAMDLEADRRMATVYLPELKIGMLPSRVSSGLGSLAPGEMRAAVSLLARVTESGEVLEWDLSPSVVRSRAALTYERADIALEDPSDPSHRLLSSLDRITKSLHQRRAEAGAIMLERPEISVKLGPSGEPEVRVLARTSPARRLVAELMILCNTLMAEFCRREDLPVSYRSQRSPDLSGLPSDPAALSEYLNSVLGQYTLMRRLTPAEISVEPAPHRGLGVDAYVQATSPLRRYPDLVTQRQISRFLSSGSPLYSHDEVASVAQRAEEQLREIARLEDARERYWLLKYLKLSRLDAPDSDDRSATFEATVLESAPGRPALLELVEYPFRVRAVLPSKCVPGDVVTLRLHGVDLWSRAARFAHTEGRG